MQLITDEAGTSPLSNLHDAALPQSLEVYAAVAYVQSDEPFLKSCRESNKPFKLWARYDYSPATRPEILKKFLSHNSPNYQCFLVPDIFHAKVIWWKNYGVYVGSANLSDRAWLQNIEAGIFVDEEEAAESGLLEQIEDFFDSLEDRSQPLTQEIADHVEELFSSDFTKQQYQQQKNFSETRQIPELTSQITVRSKRRSNTKQDAFLKEWGETIEQLRGIAKRVSQPEYKPSWVPDHASAGIQADQLLHAYYHTFLKARWNQAAIYESHEENKKDPEKALLHAMDWWSRLPEAPNDEQEKFDEWAGYHIEHLSKEKILSLSNEQFFQICRRVNATIEHAQQVSWKQIGLSKQPPSMEHIKRIRLLSDFIYKQTNTRDDSALGVLYYVLHDGADKEIPLRLFQATKDPKWKIPHMGLSMLGEIVGWAKPDFSPPRNGRTNKALHALGYSVKIN
jgi:HKD family nuclease